MPTNRESRVSKIVEALLAEQEITLIEDIDFASGSAETFSSSGTTDSYLSVLENEEDEEEDNEEEAMQALESYEKAERRRKTTKYVDPALEHNAVPTAVLSLENPEIAELSREIEVAASDGQKQQPEPLSEPLVSATTINEYEQFKTTAEDWAHHLAVTQIWNEMTYNANIAHTNVLAQEQTNEVIPKDDRSNSMVWIRGDSRTRVFTDYLEVVLNSPQNARFVVNEVLNKIEPDDFWKLTDAKLLPDNFDYRKELDCYWRQLPVLVNQEFLTFDASDATGKMQGDAESKRQVLAYSEPDESDETNKSVETVFSVETENILPLEPGHFIICEIPAKRNYFHRYYQMQGNAVVTGFMSVNEQTDMIARNFQFRNQKTDDTQTFIIVDRKSFDLQIFDNTVLMEKIRSCETLEIIRGRGRSGRKLADLLQRIKVIRPDLAEDEAKLFQMQRAKTEQTIEYKAQLSGTYLTMYGAYMQQEPKVCEIVDNPLEPMFIEERVIPIITWPYNALVEENVLVGIDKERPIENSGAAESELPVKYRTMAEIVSYQNGGDRETDVYRFFDAPTVVERDGFKYHDPATGIGFNSVDEFKEIRNRTIEEQLSLEEQFEQAEDKIKDCLENGYFEEANRLFEQEIENIQPAWIRAHYRYDRSLDTTERVLGDQRYGILE